MDIQRITQCSGHRGALYTLAPGRSARHFLTAGSDGWITEWDLDQAETGQVIATVETQVFSMCSFPERHLLVAGNMNGGVHWIDLQQPERTRNLQHHSKGVFDIKSSGDQLYTAGGDGILTRWSVDGMRAVESIQLSYQSLRTLAFSPSGSEMAIGSSDGGIYFLNLADFTFLREFPKAHSNSVFTVAYTPDGRYLLSGGRDAMLRVWDLENDGALVSEQAAHWYTINHMVFSPDGRYFATASRDKTIRIWSSQAVTPIQTIDTIRYGCHIGSVNRLLWRPDCLVSCSDDKTMMIWKIEGPV